MTQIRAVLLDIEGTTSPIAFVRDVLFPYARAHLPALLASRADDPEVAAEIAAVQALEPGRDPLACLLGWMDQDAKITPLKALQGVLWREGYESGALRGAFHADAPAALAAWHRAGLRLMIYSSGSVEAQQLIFRHSVVGDLSGLISGWFDTRIGAKREAASYRRIAAEAGLKAGEIAFLSDIGPELDAAREAGMATCQLVRAEDGTVAAGNHPHAADLPGAGRVLGLAEPA